MRRTVIAIVAATLLLVVTAVPAAAARPIHIPPTGGPAAPLEFAAGEVCAFPLRNEVPVDQTKVTIWEHEDGSARFLSRGYVEQTVMNTANGRSVTQRGGYVIDVRVHADGSVDVKASGNLFAWYFPGDAVVGLGPGAYLVRGHGTETYDASGALVAARFHGGRVIALCDVLAD